MLIMWFSGNCPQWSLFNRLYTIDAYMHHTTFSLLCRGNHCTRAVTIESLLESGCGLSHKSAQDGYMALV